MLEGVYDKEGILLTAATWTTACRALAPRPSYTVAMLGYPVPVEFRWAIPLAASGPSPPPPLHQRRSPMPWVTRYLHVRDARSPCAPRRIKPPTKMAAD